MDNLLFRNEVYAIVGAAIEVHRELGAGFLEAVYQEAMEIELAKRHIPFDRQKLLPISYKSIVLKKEYIADLVCYDQIIVELKTVPIISKIEEAQLLNYLKATNFQVGLLINFNSQSRLEWKRMIYTQNHLFPSHSSRLKQ